MLLFDQFESIFSSSNQHPYHHILNVYIKFNASSVWREKKISLHCILSKISKSLKIGFSVTLFFMFVFQIIFFLSLSLLYNFPLFYFLVPGNWPKAVEKCEKPVETLQLKQTYPEKKTNWTYSHRLQMVVVLCCKTWNIAS